LASAWKVLFEAQRTDRLATTGAYRHVRRPQYDGVVLIMFGLLLQWPTLVTVIMFPIPVFMCLRLARTEESWMEARFGDEYWRYAAQTPAFLPRWRALRQPGG
jgi:protein-S-isoprenylcysteine O-methyltransferase Ste14